MKKITLSIMLLSACFSSRALQDSLVNSLRVELQGKANDLEAYYFLHDLALGLIDFDNEKALIVIEEAAPIATRTADTLCIVKSQRVRGQIQFRLGLPQATISVVEPLLAFKTITQYTDEYLSILNLLAVCHLSMSQFDEALKYHLKTLHFAQERNNGAFIATSLMNMGICYYKLRDYDKALPFMIRSYHLSDSLGRVDFSQPLNISLCHAYLNEFEKAKHYLTLSEKICGDDCPPAARLHLSYASGSILFGRNALNEAEREYRISLEISDQLQDHRMFLDNIYMLARIHAKRNEFQRAGAYLDQAQKLISQSIPFNMEMIKVYGQLGELYLRIEDYERAAFYQSHYIVLRDSIYNETVTTSLMEVESEYRQKANLSKIEAQTAIIANRDKTIGRQQALTTVVGLLCIMTAVTLAVIFRSYRLKKMINTILEKKIRERTTEMEAAMRELLTNLEVRAHELSRLSGIINETIKSLTGLSRVASQIDKDDLRKCLTQLRNMMVQSAKRLDK